MTTQTQHNVAWGLELGAEAVCLVRLRRDAGGYRADRFRRAPLDPQRAGATVAETVAGLADGPLDAPVVACVADQRIVHRMFSLPFADRVTLAKMIAGQMEVLFGPQSEQLAVAWHAYDEADQTTRRVWVAAARGQEVARAVDACRRLGGTERRVVPVLSGLAALWQVSGDTRGSVALVDAAGDYTAMAVAIDGRVVRCGAVEEPVGASAFHLRELFDHCTADLDDAQRPTRCIVFDRCPAADAAAAVAEAVGLPATEARPPAVMRVGDGLSFAEAAPALGAALTALAAEVPRLDLSDGPRADGSSASGRRRRSFLRWAAVTAWIAVALVALFGADRGRARRLAAAMDDLQARTGGQEALARQEAIGQYLQANGPTPLEALDVITSLLPDQTVLATWSLDRSRTGTVLHFTGKAPNDKAFQTLLQAAMEMGDVIAWRPEPEGGGVKFTIRIELDRRANDRLIRRSHATTSQPSEAPASTPASAPASTPASAPASAPSEGGGEGGAS